MVIDLFSKYGWIRSIKVKKTETVSKAFNDIFKNKRKPRMLWTDKGSEFISKHFKDFSKKKESNCITLKMKRNLVLLRDGIKQLKQICGRCLLQITTLFTGTR